MAGLFDMLQQASNDPAQSQGILRFGLSLLASKGNFGNAVGQAGLQGLQGAQDYRNQQFQRQIQQSQLDQIKRQKTMQDLPGQFVTGGVKLPTMDNRDVGQPGAAPVPAKGFDFSGYTNSLMGLNPMQGLQMQAMLKKDETPIKLGKDEKLLAPGTFATLATNPGEGSQTELQKLIAAKDALPQGHPNRGVYEDAIARATRSSSPSAIQEYEYAKGQGYAGTFEQWDTARKKAGASSVSVNTGQHGFDNTLKLRTDFRQEPIYKAHQEVQSAYAQIKQGLAQNSPAGDLAGATKIMKLLDPNSVVRESELGMAMAATGLLDRVTSYATNVINGTKLTPAQRKDFLNLAERLYGESAKQVNAKQTEYRGIAERNGLNARDAVGDPAPMPGGGGNPKVLRYDAQGNRVP